MASNTDGIPLLSRTPPDPYHGVDPSHCRRCNKEFNFLFTRLRLCNHCGYAYCSSCSDFQALMPRSNGYDSMPVCISCMEMLTITSSSRSRLKGLPLSKLRSYMKSYNIPSGAAVEKDDLVDAIVQAKDVNGCLRAHHEEYYRQHSVPQWNGERRPRNIFSRLAAGNDPAASTQSRPQTQPQQQQRHYPPPPGPPPQHYSVPRPPPPPPPPSFHHAPNPYQYVPYQAQPLYTQFAQHPPHTQYPPQFQSQGHSNLSNQGSSTLRPTASHMNLSSSSASNPPNSRAQHRTGQSPPRSRSAAPTVAPTPAVPHVPSLNELLQKTNEEIGKLSISTLKTILYDNRVNNSTGVLEKQDLVQKVVQLVTDERLDREIRARQEREEAERMEWARQDRIQEEERRRAEERQREEIRQSYRQNHGDDEQKTTTQNASSDTAPRSTVPSFADTASPSFSSSTADGLCVVCQDEHANMAIIDCGHLALCKACSDLIMQTSRECPLCRTRIVTEQRLLRIFRS